MPDYLFKEVPDYLLREVPDYLLREVLDYLLFKEAFDYQHLVSIREDSNRLEVPTLRSRRIADK